MDKPRLAIVYGETDLLRIIPTLHTEEDVVDLKISFVGEKIPIKCVDKTGEYPLSVSAKGELSYHSSKRKRKQRLSAELHIKEKEGSRSSYPFRFHNISDLSKYGEFPVPICSIVISNPEGPRFYPKQSHRIFNFIGDYGFSPNMVEIYFVGKDFDSEEWAQKWPTIACLSELSPIEYLIQGPDLRVDIEMLFSQGIVFCSGMGVVFSDFGLLCKARYLPNAMENCIRIYNNLDYVELLGLQPIQLINEKTKAPISKIIHAYSRDLNRQRSRRVNDLDLRIDLRTWDLLFQTAIEKHKEHLAKCKIILIPIIDIPN